MHFNSFERLPVAVLISPFEKVLWSRQSDAPITSFLQNDLKYPFCFFLFFEI